MGMCTDGFAVECNWCRCQRLRATVVWSECRHCDLLAWVGQTNVAVFDPSRKWFLKNKGWGGTLRFVHQTDKSVRPDQKHLQDWWSQPWINLFTRVKWTKDWWHVIAAMATSVECSLKFQLPSGDSAAAVWLAFVFQRFDMLRQFWNWTNFSLSPGTLHMCFKMHNKMGLCC